MTPTETHLNDHPRRWKKDGWRKHPLLPGGWKTGGSPCSRNYCECQLCGQRPVDSEVQAKDTRQSIARRERVGYEISCGLLNVSHLPLGTRGSNILGEKIQSSILKDLRGLGLVPLL